ncbi:hypothetical protein PENSPDRAFT_738133 [Peniophora sp. CONT]|nr:hypothetical protein PENSPDRAFT_738133 [Peniophora sp. CONT]
MTISLVYLAYPSNIASRYLGRCPVEDHGGHNPNAKFICPASSCGKAFTRQYLKTHYGKEHEDEDDWDSVKNSLRPASASGVASVTVKSEPAPRRLLLFISEDDYETLLKRPHIVAKRPSERPVRCSKCEGLSSNARHFREHMEVCDGRVAYAESTHQSMQTPASSSSSSISQAPLTKKRKLTEVSANAQPDRQGSTVSASRYTVSDPGTFSTIQWSTSSSTLTYTLSTFSGSRSSSNTPPNYTITSFSENGWATSSPEQLASFKGVL